MIKEWDKFHSEFKKLKSAADRYTDRAAEGFLKQMVQSKVKCDKHESDLSLTVDSARVAGVAGKALADFLNHKPFAEAKKKLDGAVADLQSDIKDLSEFCREAQKVSNQIVDLHKALEKDLKARKSVTDGRRETEALLDTVDDEYQRLMKVVATKNRPARATLIYPEVYAKTVAKLISDAPAVQVKDDGLPDLLDLKVMKEKVTRVMTGANKLTRLCGQAVEALPDAKAALAALKLARTELDRIKDIDRDYRAVASKHHKDIAASKDRSKIEKLLDAIAKSLLEGERLMQTTTLAVKKAT